MQGWLWWAHTYNVAPNFLIGDTPVVAVGSLPAVRKGGAPQYGGSALAIIRLTAPQSGSRRPSLSSAAHRD